MVYTLPQMVEAAAKRFPQKDAFRCQQQAITFGQLNQQMNQLAHLLIDLGVKRGDRIGVYMSRSLETALAIYGIMQAGAAFVPLDPLAPIERIHFQLEDCGIDYLISQMAQRRKLALLSSSRLKGIIGVKEAGKIPAYPWETVQQIEKTDRPAIKVMENDLAYIM